MSKILLLFILFALTGCEIGRAHYMTSIDYQELSVMRRHNLDKNSIDQDRDYIGYKIIMSSPINLVKEATKNNDYRPIGLAMGYHASEEDSKPVGIECSNPIETQDIIGGCVPAPSVFYKLMIDYNLTLITQPNFPSKYGCKASEDAKKFLYSTDIRNK